MKDIRIDGKFQRVFVLKEEKDRIVYIPIKALHRVDYDRLVEIENKAKNKNDLLDNLKETTLSNGRNALVQFDSIIQVANVDPQKPVGSRLKKPNEAAEQEEIQQLMEANREANEEPKPARKKPGPKPKTQTDE